MYKWISNVAVVGLVLLGSVRASPLQSRSSVNVTNPAYNKTLTEELELAATDLNDSSQVADRLTILKNQGPSDAYFKYNFNLAANPNPGGGTGLGGSGVLANRKNFPALIGLGVAASVGFLNPCGMNTPHTHPRATEFLTIAQGGNVKTGFIQEEGENTELTTILDLYEGAIFPMGSIHYEFNDNCDPAVFIAAFSSDDPGLSRVAQNFFGLNPDVVDADLGYPTFLDQTNIAQFETTIPPAFALGTKECLNRCGMSH